MPRTPPSASVDFTETELRNWKLLAQFQRRLEPLLDRPGSVAAALTDRRLSPGAYLSSVLFTLVNPAIKTARALCGASHFQRVQAEVCGGPIALSSFSEMQHLCDPGLLAGLLRELATEALPIFGDPRLRAQEADLIAIDGTLLPALPRMAWAWWQNPQNRAGKLHLES